MERRKFVHHGDAESQFCGTAKLDTVYLGLSGERQGRRESQFCRTAKLDAPRVRPKGERQGWRESQFFRKNELDTPHIRPKVMGHGKPISHRERQRLSSTRHGPLLRHPSPCLASSSSPWRKPGSGAFRHTVSSGFNTSGAGLNPAGGQKPSFSRLSSPRLMRMPACGW